MKYNWIYEMDCIEGMREHIEDDSVDVVITSPPYNIGVDYGEYEDNMSFDDYLSMINELSFEIKRVLKDDGSLFFNVGDMPSDTFRSFKIAEIVLNHLDLQNTIHWIKHISSLEHGLNVGNLKPIRSDKYLSSVHEYIFHFSIGGDSKINKRLAGVPYKSKENLDKLSNENEIGDMRDRGDCWLITYENINDGKDHPAAYPVKLPMMCLRLIDFDEDTIVLDPFMGSGTTAVAAKQLGCKYIGFEIDSDYIELSKSRIGECDSGVYDKDDFVSGVEKEVAIEDVLDMM